MVKIRNVAFGRIRDRALRAAYTWGVAGKDCDYIIGCSVHLRGRYGHMLRGYGR